MTELEVKEEQTQPRGAGMQNQEGGGSERAPKFEDALKKIILFISLLFWVFAAAWAFSSCGACASHYGGFSRCRARALGRKLSGDGAWAQQFRGAWE